MLTLTSIVIKATNHCRGGGSSNSEFDGDYAISLKASIKGDKERNFEDSIEISDSDDDGNI
jgi:hypothetical protein